MTRIVMAVPHSCFVMSPHQEIGPVYCTLHTGYPTERKYEGEGGGGEEKQRVNPHPQFSNCRY